MYTRPAWRPNPIPLMATLTILDDNTMDSLAPLFGAENGDVRYKLIAHKLISIAHHAQIESMKSPSKKFDELIEEYAKKDFVNHLSAKNFNIKYSQNDDDELSVEVCAFFKFLRTLKISTMTQTQQNSLLNLIVKYSDVAKTSTDAGVQWLISEILYVDMPRLREAERDMAWLRNLKFDDSNALINKLFESACVNKKNKNPNPLIDNLLKLKTFSYKLSKFVLNQLLKEAKDSAMQVTTTQTHSAWLDQWDTPPVDKYSRDPKDSKKLYITDKDGKKVEVQKGSQKYNDLQNNDCLDYGLKDLSGNTTGQSCSQFLNECMVSGSADSIQNCKKFMMNTTFWSDIKKEVYDDMTPTTAEALLRQFGVKTITEDDVVARRKLVKFQSIEKWIEELKTQVPGVLKDDEYDSIIKNTRLIEYLKALVSKINSSPAILNENYTGSSSETQPYDPNSNKNTLYWTYGLRTASPYHNQNKVQISRLASVINNNTIGYRQRLGGLGALSGLGFLLPINMQGGGATPENYNFTFSQLENQYNGLKAQLQAHGKEIEPGDDKNIQATFESLKKTEKKLVEVIAVTEKYKNLISVYGNNDPDKLLSTEHLAEFVKARESQFDKTISKQQNIVNILKTIAEGIPEILKAVKAKA